MDNAPPSSVTPAGTPTQTATPALPVLSYATPGWRPRWQRTIRVLLILGVIVAAVAVPFCAQDVESIMATGPALLLIGALLLICSILDRDRWAMVAAIQHGSAVIGVALLIAGLQWSPRVAQRPVTAIVCANAVVVFILACVAIGKRRIVDAIASEAG